MRSSHLFPQDDENKKKQWDVSDKLVDEESVPIHSMAPRRRFLQFSTVFLKSSRVTHQTALWNVPVVFVAMELGPRKQRHPVF